MSVSAELVRLWLRWSMKRSNHPGLPIAERRRRLARFETRVPDPPRGVEVLERTLGGIGALRVWTPALVPDRRILFLHGGAYVAGSAALYGHILWRFALAAKAEIVAIDYRLAPEHPFPAALDDAVAAWLALLGEGADPRCCAVVGDSAGGGLALALLLRLRDRRLPMPAAAAGLSPWTDLALTGATLRTNAIRDPMLNIDDVPIMAAHYLAGADPQNPYASPLYGDLAGLPPVLIQVGSDELLLDDSVRMAKRLRQARVETELEIWPRMPHVWHAFAPIMPEARRAIERVGAFVRHHTAGEARAAAA